MYICSLSLEPSIPHDYGFHSNSLEPSSREKGVYMVEVRNIPLTASKQDIERVFSSFAPVSQIIIDSCESLNESKIIVFYFINRCVLHCRE